MVSFGTNWRAQPFGSNRPVPGASIVPSNGGYDLSALLDFNPEQGRYRFNGVNYSTVAALATGMGGTNSGNVLSIGPHDTGTTAYTSNFSSDIDGWAETLNPANGDLSVSSGNLVATVTTTNYRASKAITASRKAFLVSATRVTNSLSSLSLAAGNNAGLSSAAVASVAMTANATSYSIVGATDGSTFYAGIQTGGTGAGTITNVTAKEVLPYNGFTQLQGRFERDFTTGSSFASQQTLYQWGSSVATAQSVRLIIDTSGVLRLIVTTSISEVANLSIATLSTSTRYTVRGSFADNAVYANLNGGALLSDTSVAIPPTGLFWDGRGQSGETAGGTTHRSRVYATAASDPNSLVDPSKGFRIFGDSTAAGSGSTTPNRWFEVLTLAYNPDRAYANAGVGGETSTQMLARVAADTAVYRQWSTIFMDRPNGGESSATWIANMKAAVAYLGTDRWFVMPPAQDVPDTSIANIAEVQALLLSDPFFAGHTLGSSDQAAYLTAVNSAGERADGTHFDDSGQAIQATYIKAFFDAAGW